MNLDDALRASVRSRLVRFERRSLPTQLLRELREVVLLERHTRIGHLEQPVFAWT